MVVYIGSDVKPFFSIFFRSDSQSSSSKKTFSPVLLGRMFFLLRQVRNSKAWHFFGTSWVSDQYLRDIYHQVMIVLASSGKFNPSKSIKFRCHRRGNPTYLHTRRSSLWCRWCSNDTKYFRTVMMKDGGSRRVWVWPGWLVTLRLAQHACGVPFVCNLRSGWCKISRSIDILTLDGPLPVLSTPKQQLSRCVRRLRHSREWAAPTSVVIKEWI